MAGGVREAGGERAGSGIPKVAGTGRKGEKFRNIAYYFTLEIEQRGGNPYRRGREAGVKGTGGGSFRSPCLPPLNYFSFCVQYKRLCDRAEQVSGKKTTGDSARDNIV